MKILKHFFLSATRTENKKSHHKKSTVTVENVTPNNQTNKKCIFEEVLQEFESKCQCISHFCCQSCYKTGISIKPSCINKQICTTCQAQKTSKERMEKDLPIWYDKNNIVQYQLPSELKCLCEGEKLLLQQVSPYVPLLHLKDGQIGSRGHVCSFAQDITEPCSVLPRLPDDVQFVKVVKQYHEEGGKIASKSFTIRKKAVLDALKWLKQYNVEYKHIEIKESNLDWIENGDSQELPPSLIQTIDDHSAKNSPASVDLGPSDVQTLSGLQSDSSDTCEIDTVLGILPSEAENLPKKKMNQ
jgi:hypothetical protein